MNLRKFQASGEVSIAAITRETGQNWRPVKEVSGRRRADDPAAGFVGGSGLARRRRGRILSGHKDSLAADATKLGEMTRWIGERAEVTSVVHEQGSPHALVAWCRREHTCRTRRP